MRILLDEQLPRVLAAQLPNHEVRTVQSQGWRGVKNGALLRLASEAGFEVFLTADRGIEFEQNLEQVGLRVVVMVARSNRLEHLLPVVGKIDAVLHELESGQLAKVSA